MNNEQSVVSRCDAVTCRFNRDQNCTAGQIEVSLSADQARCLTFSPAQDASAESDRPGQGQ
ncbi:DUF1540 domain-containing protein [Deinococcus radiophilus]|uniref:DUF1540 domain-containing protein n=2 Tax=Deinococcus radiophilus TaxID=32062 RepID=A0A431VUE2_9DEIO|nr:DUF1540 domain-containing protein [Deinococcus radiophilus]RTR26877.1 DUF1540 domain-containing protein [Deinococcus radiophilus]UFA51772.1 DUF1540 domain-containing protein [Deinococcus radiophilus]